MEKVVEDEVMVSPGASLSAARRPSDVCDQQFSSPLEGELLAALEDLISYGCPACNGDCASANPPMAACPIQPALAAITKARSQEVSTRACPVCGGHDDDRQLMCEACGGVGMLGDPAENNLPVAVAQATCAGHGTAQQAIDFILDSHAQIGPDDETLFLRCWREGDLDEWPEYYEWLAASEARASIAKADPVDQSACAASDAARQLREGQ